MPKQASIMSPTRNQNAIESAYEMMYKKRILRRQMLRLKMLEEQKYEKKTIQTQSVTSKRISTLKLNSVLSVVAKKTSPLLLRTCKPITSPNAKPINIAITFNATSKNIEREFKTFEINAVKQESPVMQEKARKQWPKLVCSMEISPITSNDFILNGAVLPSETNFSFSPPKPPPPHSPKVPITAPPTSSPPPFVSPNCAKGTNLLHSTTTTQGADNLLAPKKRRFVLSDRPPPMFKTPLKDPYKADYKSVPFADLRRKITGSMPELRRETLKMREDDCISIFAQTDIITDDDLIINVDRPDITPIISATKKAEIQNWVAQASSPSTTSFESDTNAPQFSSTSSSSTDKFPDSPESIHCPSINENTTLYRRFDRFQLSFNSEESESSRTESSNVATPPVPDENIQHSFKMPYSVMAKSSIVSPYSSAQLITANSRNSSDFPSSVSEYDCESAVVIPESQRRAQEVVRFDSPKDIQNASNCNISASNPTSPVPYFQRNVDILNASMNQPIIDEIKRSPPTEKMGKTVNNSLNQSIRASNQQKSNPNTFNNSKGKLTIETSNQKSAHVIKTTVSYEKPVEQTTKTPDPLNHFQFKKPPPNIPPNQLNAARNTQFNNTPPKNAANQNHSPHIFAPNDLMNYLTRPPVAPFNGPPIRGQFRSVHPYQRPSAPKCPQRFPGPRYMRMNNVHPQPQVDYRQMRPSENNILKAAQLGSPNLPPPTRNFAVQVRPNVWQQQNWYQSDETMRTAQNHSLQLSQIQAVLCNFCTWHYREGSCRFGPECKKYHQCPQEVAQSMTLLQPKEIQKIVLKLCAEKLHSVICELLDVFLRTYVRNNNVTAILDLVQPVLEVSFFSYSKMQSILSALCQLGMNYKSAILKVLYYVGASNRKLVDILFAIITDHCDPTTSSTITSHWSAIEQLLESATQLDHGVFADLCAKSLAQHTTNADHVAMLIALGRVLTAEPCKVDVQRMDQMLLVRLCERLEAVDAGGGGLGGLMRSRLLIGWTGNGVMDREGGMLEDRTISSTIPGLSNTHFISVPLQIQNSTIAAHAKNKSSATNTDRNRNNCSPDSSSYAVKSNRTSTPFPARPQPFSTNPPLRPLVTNKLHAPNNKSININQFANNEQLKNCGSNSSDTYEKTRYKSASDRDISELCRIDSIESSNYAKSASGNRRNYRENRTPEKTACFTTNPRPFNTQLFSRYSANYTRNNQNNILRQNESSKISTLLPCNNNNPSEQFTNCANTRKEAFSQQNHTGTTLNPVGEINKKSARFHSTTDKTVVSPEESHRENASATRPECYSPTCSFVSATNLSFSPKKSKGCSTCTKSSTQSDFFNKSVDMTLISPDHGQYSRSDIASHSATISERILLTPRINATATDNNHPSTPHKTFTPSISSAQTFHTPPIPSASPVNPLLNQSAHFSTQILDQSIIAHHQSLSPSTTFYNLTDCHSLYSCITKYQYNNASVLIAKERESAIEPICKMINSKTVLVSTAFAFFDVLWDHTEEHFLQFIEIKRVILYILFNIYEFLWKERCFSDAASLITTKFSNEKESFLYYKTFLPSGQCSPMQKCHRVIKLLLQEKILQPAYDWFIREEYHSTDITSDLNVLTNEKNCLIEEFLLLSYRDLDIAFNLVIFCMNRHLGDFKHHYNCILMQMINSTDHKEKVIALRERLYNDQYVYTNAQTLRSYVVEFFSHLTLNELLHIYDIISRDNVYPKLTGHEHIVTMRDTLKESEVTLILMNFLHQIVQNRIDVTWDVKIQFQTAPVTGPTMPDARSESIVYPRNLLMCSTPTDAVKRLVNVLRSFNLMLSNPADAHKWQACHTSGTVTLYKGHVQAMVRNYRGTQTFT